MAAPLSRRHTGEELHVPIPSPSDRLHVALGVALAAAALLILALPLTRSTVASAEEPSTAPVLAVSEGFSAAMQYQAQTLVAALAGGEAVPAGDSHVSHFLQGLPASELVPRPVLTAAAGIFVQGALAAPKGQGAMAVQLREPVRLTVYEDDIPSVMYSTRPTVGAALTALGAEFEPHDRILPSPETSLTAGLHVYVERATEIGLKVGKGDLRTVHTHADTVRALLDDRNIDLDERDYVVPTGSTPLRDGTNVFVTLVDREAEIEETAIPYTTVYREDPELPMGQSAVVQAGSPGVQQLEYLVTYRNGREVQRKLMSEEVTPPTNRIVAVGTYVAPTPTPTATALPTPTPTPTQAAAPSGAACSRELRVWATWYTAASAGGTGITATGTTVHKGTVAVDPSVIPLGTDMYVPGYGYGRAEDTGGAIIGNHIDLGYGPNDVKDWRTGYVTICILN